MVNLSRLFNLSNVYNPDLGDRRIFYSSVTLPQSFVFIILIVIGSFVKADIASLTIINFSAICYILLFNYWIQRQKAVFTFWNLIIEIGGVFALLLFWAFYFDINPILSFYFPMTLLFCCLLPLNFSTFQKLFLFALGLLVLIVFSVASISLGKQDWTIFYEGVGIVLFTVLVLTFKSKVVQGHREALGAYSLYAYEETIQEEDPDENELSREDHQRKEVFDDAISVLRQELISEFSWRLGLLCLISAIIVFGVAYLVRGKDQLFASCWLILAFIDVYLHHCLLRKRDLSGIYRNAFMLSLIILLWWGTLLFFNVAGDVLYSFLIAILILTLSFLPWSWYYFLSLALLFAVIGITGALYSSNLVLIIAVYALTIMLALRNSFIVRSGVLARVFSLLMSRWSESVSSLSVLHVLSWQMAELCAASNALIVFSDGRAEIIKGRKFTTSTIDTIFSQGLACKVEEINADRGIIPKKELGAQYNQALIDWFAYVPSRIIYVRLAAVIDEQEEFLYIFVPVSFWMSFSGFYKIYAGIITISSIAGMWLSSVRTRFLSSDALLATQRLISEKEYELNEVIHRVNNIAQDISIQCESMQSYLDDKENGEAQVLSSPSINEQVDRIELSIRSLSSEVSDVKLLKELLLIKSYERSEPVDIVLLVEEVEAFMRYHAYRYGTEFSLIQSHDEALAISVVSREFVDTAFRLCLKIASLQSTDNKKVQLKISKNGKMVDFEFSGAGKKITNYDQEKILARTDRIVSQKSDYLMAVVNLARLCNGTFEFKEAQGVFTNCMQLSLPALTSAKHVTQAVEGWVLLVDDNDEVTTFYARVAEALDFTYYTAASLQEARSLVADNGRPRLLITDIQLTDGSGLDLVRDIRKEFGDEVPVIVVSGSTDITIVEQVKSVGASKYLTKPVGRRKLFAEIQNIMST